jgi:hypothetical protein
VNVDGAPDAPEVLVLRGRGSLGAVEFGRRFSLEFRDLIDRFDGASQVDDQVMDGRIRMFGQRLESFPAMKRRSVGRSSNQAISLVEVVCLRRFDNLDRHKSISDSFRWAVAIGYQRRAGRLSLLHGLYGVEWSRSEILRVPSRTSLVEGPSYSLETAI